jgi:hypothetical protein
MVMEISKQKIKQTVLVSSLFFVVTVFFAYLTGIITPGNYYSPHIALRLQTDAFLEGKLSLSDSISMLDEDMVWHNQKVSQVWGLGVPMLRMPFEVVSKAFGVNSFPDRITFLFYFFVTALLLFYNLRYLYGRFVSSPHVSAFIITLSALFFPSFLSLVRTRFIVYEEVIAYGYLYSLSTLALTMFVFRKPSIKALSVLGGMASFGFFIRPTVFLYTGTIFLCSTLFLYFRRVIEKRHLFIAFFVSAIVAGLFFTSNKIRFGNFFEFGHTLNVASNVSSINVTRFSSAYKDSDNFFAKARETFALAFLLDAVPKNNTVFSNALHSWQFELLRWRFMYFPVFHLQYVAYCGILFLVLVYCFRKKVFDLVFLLGVSAVISLLVLFVFYSQNTFVSSRYFVDMSAPLFTVVCVLFLFFFKRKEAYALLGIFCVVLGFHLRDIKNDSLEVTQHSKFFPVDSKKVGSLILQNKGACTPEVTFYEKNKSDNCKHMFNKIGWNAKTGEIQDTLSFLVYNPEKISLLFSTPEGTPLTSFWNMKAKLGTEYLSVEKVVRSNESSVTVDFSAAKDTQNTKKIQTLFIQTMSVSSVIPKSNVRLERVSWSH